MDSDCDMECTAVEKAVKVFCHDRKLGALTSHGRVRGAHEGNIFQKFQDVYIDGSCRAVKGAESHFRFRNVLALALSAFIKKLQSKILFTNGHMINS